MHRAVGENKATVSLFLLLLRTPVTRSSHLTKLTHESSLSDITYVYSSQKQ